MKWLVASSVVKEFSCLARWQYVISTSVVYILYLRFYLLQFKI